MALSERPRELSTHRVRVAAYVMAGRIAARGITHGAGRISGGADGADRSGLGGVRCAVSAERAQLDPPGQLLRTLLGTPPQLERKRCGENSVIGERQTIELEQ